MSDALICRAEHRRPSLTGPTILHRFALAGTALDLACWSAQVSGDITIAVSEDVPFGGCA